MTLPARIAAMYITLMSVIMAGVLNMLFTKTRFFMRSNPPIDGGKTLSDGRRLFGDNKTWKGFFGMVVCGGLSQVLWGLICSGSDKLTAGNALYSALPNTPLVNLSAGLMFGLAYALFELPNSFIKRRLDIEAGKTGSGAVGVLFFIIDQIDSLVGVVMCLALICGMSLPMYFGYILVGAFTHIAVNLALYALHIRRNI